jgi:putative heme-binding domain-containing protein
MPGSSLASERVWKIVAYLRTHAGRASAVSLGNPKTGQELFFEKARCSQCHMVKGRGGRLGPDLSRIGAARSISYLTDKIREPDKLGKGMTVGLWWELGQPLVYQTVTVVTKEGQRITGSLRNEDTFSIQLMDPSEELHGFWKKDLEEVIHERRSLMPAYHEQILSQTELQDLLAYLDGLREP